MKENHTPLYLWLLWCIFCFYITTPWQYLRHPYTDNISVSFCMLYFGVPALACVSPLLFRCGLLIMRSVSGHHFTFFVKKNNGKKSTIHLSPYADTRCPESMRRHWAVLLSLISEAINNNESVVMHSHLFTPARTNKLIKRLASYDLNFSVTTYPRKTGLYEKLSIRFVYLLFQWSLPNLHPEGMTVVIRPLRPPHQ